MSRARSARPGLILHDDGTTPAWAECRLCGWADTWTGDDPDGGDR
jgi:hypothetical protein